MQRQHDHPDRKRIVEKTVEQTNVHGALGRLDLSSFSRDERLWVPRFGGNLECAHQTGRPTAEAAPTAKTIRPASGHAWSAGKARR